MQVIFNNESDFPNTSVQVIREKVNKLETYYDRIERAEIFLKEDDGTNEGKTLEIRLAVPGPDLFANHTDESIEKAADKVTEALRRQLKKHKEKLSDNHAPKDLPSVGPNDDEERIYLSEEQL